MMLIFAAAMMLIAQAGEWLAMPMPEGFVTAHKQKAQMGSIEERIPKGETVESWTRMITLITLYPSAEPEAYAAQFERRVFDSCLGARAWRRTPAAIDAPQGALTGVQGRVDCPRNPQTGQPETFFYRVAGRGARLYMVQVAFRSVPKGGDTAWAVDRLNSAQICATGSADPVCKR